MARGSGEGARALTLRLMRCLLLLVALLTSVPAVAEDAPSASASAAAPGRYEVPLPELEEVPEVTLPPPSPEAVRTLATRLDELAATHAADALANDDWAFIKADLDPSIVSAAAQRLSVLKDQLDADDVEAVLERGRKLGRKAIKRAKKDTGKEPPGDWLTFVLALDDRGSGYREAVHLYGMLRMLEAVGTTPAVRAMIESYAYFGELVRIDLQRAMDRLGDKAVAALLEAKKHDAKRVRNWAARQLDTLGKAIPGEAVSTTDPQVLADVIRAFGRIREVDATRVILSYANHERESLRKASRQAVVSIGEPARWHIKDVYKGLSGEKPPRAWDWKRTAQELFRAHDQSRLAPVFDRMREGEEALAAGKHAEAVAAFDDVLARAPTFPRRNDMVPAYLARGEELATAGETTAALLMLRKGLRLLPEGADTKRLESQITFLEGRALVEAGKPDRFLLARAVELDPSNEEAKALLASLAEEREERVEEDKRHVTALGIGAVAVVLLLLIGFVRRPRDVAAAAPSTPEADAPPPPGGGGSASPVAVGPPSGPAADPAPAPGPPLAPEATPAMAEEGVTSTVSDAPPSDRQG